MKNHTKDKQAIEAEVYKTLNCIDGLEKLEPSPYFYTHLQSRLEELESREYRFSIDYLYVKLLRPVLVPAFVAASIFAGILIGYWDTSPIRTENIKTIVQVYNLNESGLYDYFLTTDN